MRELDELRRMAKGLAMAGNWGQEAIELNRRLLQLSPTEAQACTRLARCYLAEGDVESASRMYLQALRIQPENRIAQNSLDGLGGEFSLELEDTLSQVIGQMEDFDEAFETGRALKEVRELKLAIRALQRAVEIQPKDHALVSLASAYRAIGRLQMAEELYREVLARSRNYAAQVGLAAVYKDKKMWDESVDLCRWVLNHADKDSTRKYALNCLGSVFFHKGELEEAEKCFHEASKFPGNPDESMGNLKKIREEYRKRKNEIGVQRIGELLRQIGGLRYKQRRMRARLNQYRL